MHSVLIGAFAAVVGACGAGDISEQGARFGEPGNPADGVGSGNPQAPNAPTIPGDPFPQDDPTCPDAAAVVTASNGWQSATASQTAFAQLQLSLMARPEAAGLDAVLAVGGQDIVDFSDAAILVRFADNGLIDARDGPVYDRDIAFAYEPGVWYSIVISADVARQTYDVEVARCGEPPQTLITGAAFRSDVGISDQLTTWAAWSSQSAKLELMTPSWVASGSCARATCESLGLECGAPNDGCSGSLSCGGCGDGEACAAGTCVEVSPPPPSSGGPPGGLADNCTLNTALNSACICGGSQFDEGYCCDEGFSYSACSTTDLYVVPGGTGAQTGADWANAYDGLPGALTRDRVYWIADGSYGTGLTTFDDAASGSLGITIRKATEAAHGTSTGWLSSYGDGVATFGTWDFVTDRYTIDGGEINGIELTGSSLGGGLVDADNADRIVLRNIELDGATEKSGTTQTQGYCHGFGASGASRIVLDRMEIHDFADDGIELFTTNLLHVFNSKIHNGNACGTDGVDCDGPCFNGHSDGIELISVTNSEFVGNMVYDIKSTGAVITGDLGAGPNTNLLFVNNIFYTPETGLTVSTWDAPNSTWYNNVIWGRTQGSKFGGVAFGTGMTNLVFKNNIVTNINFSHLSYAFDPLEHDIDYNVFGVVDSGEYTLNANDIEADPRFAGIPMSSNAGDHKGSDLMLEDFVPAASEAVDTGTPSGSAPAYDIVGEQRPQGGGMDRGVFEATP